MKLVFLFSWLLISGLSLSVQTTSVDHAKVGSLAPDAKAIDADFFFSFNRGAVEIVKGNVHALIDAQGKIIAPFGKYAFYGGQGSDNGLFLIRTKANPAIQPSRCAGKNHL